MEVFPDLYLCEMTIVFQDILLYEPAVERAQIVD
jgi:hypothetical protein